MGAAILLANEQTATIVAGTNVENASYRLTSCAEQAAIAAAVTCIGPAIRIRAVAVVNLNGAACMPCGACRQTIWSSRPAEDRGLLSIGGAVATVATTVGALLPAGFRAESQNECVLPELEPHTIRRP